MPVPDQPRAVEESSPSPSHVVETAGSLDPAAPLVVLLHGRGSSEREIIALADQLTPGPAYAAVRAPIAEGGGYAWFANRGIGRPVAESLNASMAWFRNWLDAAAPVVLVGFSGGAAFAGGLILADPQRFSGAAILYGTLPFDAGVPVTPARLTGLPVFVAQGDQDRVLPPELLDRTWRYLLTDSAAPAYARRDPGGHQISAQTLGELGGWIHERFSFLTRPDANDHTADSVQWAALPEGHLPLRTGQRPAVSWTTPQEQLSDNAPLDLQERLFARIRLLAGVSTAQSAISVPGARGLMVKPAPNAPVDSFLVPSVGEFAHQHPAHDGSLHLALPPELVADAVAKGWAAAHPLAGIRLARGMVMVYGPRDENELHLVAAMVETSHAYATEANADRL